MEGYLWLLLQTLPLIAVAALVFFFLGWRWRGRDLTRQACAPAQKLDPEDDAARSLREERDTARNLEEKLRLKLTETQAELQEANDRQTQLQKEILRLSDQLREKKSEDSSSSKE